ncbi:hypothetical protein CEXT_64251 [Caerostris extrusa]|uniref:Uncharacterized protein n=1 Tax=Caerostris extrusa TaxID=172846 RepID=A0AAV4SR81_CAEEX|nr:hypothetical protein CEXT_64251 [Caerostris extrusa]
MLIAEGNMAPGGTTIPFLGGSKCTTKRLGPNYRSEIFFFLIGQSPGFAVAVKVKTHRRNSWLSLVLFSSNDREAKRIICYWLD